MEIAIINQSEQSKWESYQELFEQLAEKTVTITQSHENACASVIFVDAKQIHQINKEYRNIDRPTDVISFALQDEVDTYEKVEEEDELGDIFINVEAIVEQAKAYGHSEKRECCFLFLHGLLHLFGYDHMEEADEKQMFQLQDVILDAIVAREVDQ